MSSALLVSDQDRLVSDAKETTNRSNDDDSDGSAVFSAEPKVLITDGCSEIWDALFLHYQIMRSVHLNLSVSAIIC